MKYSIPTDFSDSLLKSIDSEHVGELYGKLPRDFVGGGRPSFILPSVTKKKFIAHVKKCREHGIDFNYLLNSTCIGNRELTRSGSRKLKKLLDMLIKAKVSTVTVSIPYILEYVKRNYPELKVSVSVMAGVDSPEKARYWESLGADRITLPSVCGLYRNFPLLRQIRNAVSCELKLIANLTCLHRCPLWMYHASGHSHASQTGDPSRGFVIDYAYLRCNSLKLE
ncbi:MAG: peptidase U32, partial [Elusimicrobia bacterium]|nr:peptidase U32 [Elusimicrobiota bacterium]